MKTYKQLQNTWLTRIGDVWVQDEHNPELFINQETQKVVSQREIDCSPDWFEEVKDRGSWLGIGVAIQDIRAGEMVEREEGTGKIRRMRPYTCCCGENNCIY